MKYAQNSRARTTLWTHLFDEHASGDDLEYRDRSDRSDGFTAFRRHPNIGKHQDKLFTAQSKTEYSYLYQVCEPLAGLSRHNFSHLKSQ